MRDAQASAIEFSTNQTVPMLCFGCSHHAQKYKVAKPHATAAAVCRMRCLGLNRGSSVLCAICPVWAPTALLVTVAREGLLRLIDYYGRMWAGPSCSNGE